MNTARKMAVLCTVLALALIAVPALADQAALHALGLRMARPSPAMAMEASLPGARVQGAKKVVVTEFSLDDFMPTPMDQGDYGSCASAAVGYAWKSCTEALRDGVTPDDASRTFSPSYLYPQVNGGDDNGSYFEDNLAVLCMRGITTLADQPYDTADSDSILIDWPSQGQCDLARAHRTAYAKAKSVSFGKTLPATDPAELAKIKALILKGTPVLLGIIVDDAFDELPSNLTGFVWYPNGLHELRPAGGHALTLVGFNDYFTDGDGHVGAFEFQNSWGTDWCDDGRAYIAYDAFYDSDQVDDQVYYGVERKKEYIPTMKAQVIISHARRGDVFIQIGVGPVDKPKWSEWFYYPLLMNTLAGTYDETHADILTTLDVSGGSNRWPPSIKNDWWMRVRDNFGDGSTGSIIQFAIEGRTGWVSASGPVSMADMGDTFIHITGDSAGSPRIEAPAACDEACE